MNNCTYPAATSSGGEDWTYGDIFSAAANVVLALISAGLAFRLSRINTTSQHKVTATTKVEKRPDGSETLTRAVEATIATTEEALRAEMLLNTKNAKGTTGEPKTDSDSVAGITPAVRNAAVGVAVSAAIAATDHNSNDADRDKALVTLTQATQNPSHAGARALFTSAAARAAKAGGGADGGLAAVVDKATVASRDAKKPSEHTEEGSGRDDDGGDGRESVSGAGTGLSEMLSSMAREGKIDSILAAASARNSGGERGAAVSARPGTASSTAHSTISSDAARDGANSIAAPHAASTAIVAEETGLGGSEASASVAGATVKPKAGGGGAALTSDNPVKAVAATASAGPGASSHNTDAGHAPVSGAGAVPTEGDGVIDASEIDAAISTMIRSGAISALLGDDGAGQAKVAGHAEHVAVTIAGADSGVDAAAHASGTA